MSWGACRRGHGPPGPGRAPGPPDRAPTDHRHHEY